MLLATAGWQPGTSMLAVLKEVQVSMADSVEADATVSVRKEYKRATVQLDRLKTELFPTANGFCKDGMTALSAAEASAFLGDLSRLEKTDKICLPLAYANTIYSRAEQGAELELPMIFEIKTLLGRKTHCAILEFIDGLPDMHVLMPKWVMEDLDIQEREPVRVRGVGLDLITSVMVQPHSIDFYQAVQDSGREVRELLTDSLSRFSALTEDTAVPIEIGSKFYDVQIMSLEPRGAVRIIDVDVQHHFEFKVEFEPAPDLEDEAATKAYQDRVLASLKLRREMSQANRQEKADRRLDARQRRFDDLRMKAQAAAGADDGSEGPVETSLRMPDGSQVKGKFREGAPVAALVRLALASAWAEKTLPWAVHLRMNFPKKVLKDGEDTVTKELHRAALSVQEEQAPENDDELFAVLGEGNLKHRTVRSESEPQAQAPLPLPGRNEDDLLATTQRAFELQRFLRAGYDLKEASERYAAGEILPPTAASKRAAPRPPMASSEAAPAKPALERSLSEQEERENRIQDVMNFTGSDREVAEKALEENQWITDLAVNRVLDSLMG